MNIMDICGAYIMIYYPMDPLNPNCIYIQLQGFPVPLKQILGVMPRLELLGTTAVVPKLVSATARALRNKLLEMQRFS